MERVELIRSLGPQNIIMISLHKALLLISLFTYSLLLPFSLLYPSSSAMIFMSSKYLCQTCTSIFSASIFIICRNRHIILFLPMSTKHWFFNVHPISFNCCMPSMCTKQILPTCSPGGGIASHSSPPQQCWDGNASAHPYRPQWGFSGHRVHIDFYNQEHHVTLQSAPPAYMPTSCLPHSDVCILPVLGVK